jgi:hypothetical protein
VRPYKYILKLGCYEGKRGDQDKGAVCSQDHCVMLIAFEMNKSEKIYESGWKFEQAEGGHDA